MSRSNFAVSDTIASVSYLGQSVSFILLRIDSFFLGFPLTLSVNKSLARVRFALGILCLLAIQV